MPARMERFATQHRSTRVLRLAVACAYCSVRCAPAVRQPGRFTAGEQHPGHMHWLHYALTHSLHSNFLARLVQVDP
eukprot:1066017-Pelagomonas_calceolata.AAC.2